jgi:exopolysaccharide biosynthesis polyprenyl glycosylphosphotransferase
LLSGYNRILALAEMIPRLYSLPPPAVGTRLPEVDVRQQLDDAARRGWIEIGRRLGRAGTLFVSDTAALLVAALASAWFLDALAIAPGAADLRPLVTILFVVQPLVLGVSGAYGATFDRTSLGRMSMAVVISTGLAVGQLHLSGAPWAPGLDDLHILVAQVAWTIPLVFLGRLAIDRMLKHAYRRGIGQRRVLVIGSEAEMVKMKRMLREQRAEEIRVMGRLSPTYHREAGALEAVSDLEIAVRTHDVWGVIVASSNLSFEALETIFDRCFELGVAVSVIPKTLHRFGPRLELRKTRAGALLRLQPAEFGIPQLTIKRAMDLVFSVVLLALSWPLFLAIAAAIRLDSKGPILFRQVRAGLGGNAFGMYKFRTMIANAEDIKSDLHHLNESGDPRLFKIRNDPRVTRVGRILRRTSLDELPQLFNVLAGEMSLIGPRPFFLEDLQGYADHHLDRLKVLPGITGWWQVKGRSAVVDFEEVIRLDREYIERWSVWFDIKILLLTLPTVFRRTGAY